jgi:hypothetical protein
MMMMMSRERDDDDDENDHLSSRDGSQPAVSYAYLLIIMTQAKCMAAGSVVTGECPIRAKSARLFKKEPWE